MLRITILAIAALALTGCYGRQPSQPTEPTSPPPVVRDSAGEEPHTMAVGEGVLVRLETDKGVIELQLDPTAAPKTVANFVKLVNDSFYNDMPFHRVEPGFVIQAGDPALINRAPVGYTIPDEPSPIKHLRGAIAMARLSRGGQTVPNSADTQFYICLGDAPHLDRMRFTAFGRVTKGLDVIDKIVVGDVITKATVIE